MKKMAAKWGAAALANLILFTQVLFSPAWVQAAELDFWRSRQIQSPATIVLPSFSTSVHSFPFLKENIAGFAHLDSNFLEKRKNNQLTIVLIQDIHHNIEAQRNIGEVLKRTRDVVIGVEAAVGPFNFEPFRSFPVPSAAKNIGDYLLSQNMISAVSWMGLTTGSALPPIVGVDDAALYTANIRAYQQAEPQQAAAQKEIDQQIMSLEKLPLSGAARNLFTGLLAFHRGQTTIQEYLTLLAGKNSLKTFPTLQKFRDALQFEKKLDLVQAEKQRDRLMAELAHRDPSAFNTLTKAAQAVAAGQLSPVEFYEQLKVDAKQFGELASYVRYLKTAGSIDRGRIFVELAGLRNQTIETLPTADRSVLQKLTKVLLTDKLVKFELTPEEWSEYVILSEAKDLDYSPLAQNDSFRHFEDFYRLAEARNEKMAANLMAALVREKKQTGVLVAGGFHTAGLSPFLKQKGFSVLVVTPKFDVARAGSGSEYLKTFLRNTTPLTQLVRGEKVTLGDAAGIVGPVEFIPGRDPGKVMRTTALLFVAFALSAGLSSAQAGESLGRISNNVQQVEIQEREAQMMWSGQKNTVELTPNQPKGHGEFYSAVPGLENVVVELSDSLSSKVKEFFTSYVFIPAGYFAMGGVFLFWWVGFVFRGPHNKQEAFLILENNLFFGLTRAARYLWNHRWSLTPADYLRLMRVFDNWRSRNRAWFLIAKTLASEEALKWIPTAVDLAKDGQRLFVSTYNRLLVWKVINSDQYNEFLGKVVVTRLGPRLRRVIMGIFSASPAKKAVMAFILMLPVLTGALGSNRAANMSGWIVYVLSLIAVFGMALQNGGSKDLKTIHVIPPSGDMARITDPNQANKYIRALKKQSLTKASLPGEFKIVIEGKKPFTASGVVIEIKEDGFVYVVRAKTVKAVPTKPEGLDPEEKSKREALRIIKSNWFYGVKEAALFLYEKTKNEKADAEKTYLDTRDYQDLLKVYNGRPWLFTPAGRWVAKIFTTEVAVEKISRDVFCNDHSLVVWILLRLWFTNKLPKKARRTYFWSIHPELSGFSKWSLNLLRLPSYLPGILLLMAGGILVKVMFISAALQLPGGEAPKSEPVRIKIEKADDGSYYLRDSTQIKFIRKKFETHRSDTYTLKQPCKLATQAAIGVLVTQVSFKAKGDRVSLVLTESVIAQLSQQNAPHPDQSQAMPQPSVPRTAEQEIDDLLAMPDYTQGMPIFERKKKVPVQPVTPAHVISDDEKAFRAVLKAQADSDQKKQFEAAKRNKSEPDTLVQRLAVEIRDHETVSTAKLLGRLNEEQWKDIQYFFAAVLDPNKKIQNVLGSNIDKAIRFIEIVIRERGAVPNDTIPFDSETLAQRSLPSAATPVNRPKPPETPAPATKDKKRDPVADLDEGLNFLLRQPSFGGGHAWARLLYTKAKEEPYKGSLSAVIKAVKASSNAPQALLNGINHFLDAIHTSDLDNLKNRVADAAAAAKYSDERVTRLLSDLKHFAQSFQTPKDKPRGPGSKLLSILFIFTCVAALVVPIVGSKYAVPMLWVTIVLGGVVTVFETYRDLFLGPKKLKSDVGIVRQVAGQFGTMISNRLALIAALEALGVDVKNPEVKAEIDAVENESPDYLALKYVIQNSAIKEIYQRILKIYWEHMFDDKRILSVNVAQRILDSEGPYFRKNLFMMLAPYKREVDQLMDYDIVFGVTLHMLKGRGDWESGNIAFPDLAVLNPEGNFFVFDDLGHDASKERARKLVGQIERDPYFSRHLMALMQIIQDPVKIRFSSSIQSALTLAPKQAPVAWLRERDLDVEMQMEKGYVVGLNNAEVMINPDVTKDYYSLVSELMRLLVVGRLSQISALTPGKFVWLLNSPYVRLCSASLILHSESKRHWMPEHKQQTIDEVNEFSRLLLANPDAYEDFKHQRILYKAIQRTIENETISNSKYPARRNPAATLNKTILTNFFVFLAICPFILCAGFQDGGTNPYLSGAVLAFSCAMGAMAIRRIGWTSEPADADADVKAVRETLRRFGRLISNRIALEEALRAQRVNLDNPMVQAEIEAVENEYPDFLALKDLFAHHDSVFKLQEFGYRIVMEIFWNNVIHGKGDVDIIKEIFETKNERVRKLLFWMAWNPTDKLKLLALYDPALLKTLRALKTHLEDKPLKSSERLIRTFSPTYVEPSLLFPEAQNPSDQEKLEKLIMRLNRDPYFFHFRAHLEQVLKKGIRVGFRNGIQGSKSLLDVDYDDVKGGSVIGIQGASLWIDSKASDPYYLLVSELMRLMVIDELIGKGSVSKDEVMQLADSPYVRWKTASRLFLFQENTHWMMATYKTTATRLHRYAQLLLANPGEYDIFKGRPREILYRSIARDLVSLKPHSRGDEGSVIKLKGGQISSRVEKFEISDMEMEMALSSITKSEKQFAYRFIQRFKGLFLFLVMMFPVLGVSMGSDKLTVGSVLTVVGAVLVMAGVWIKQTAGENEKPQNDLIPLPLGEFAAVAAKSLELKDWREQRPSLLGTSVLVVHNFQEIKDLFVRYQGDEGRLSILKARLLLIARQIAAANKGQGAVMLIGAKDINEFETLLNEKTWVPYVRFNKENVIFQAGNVGYPVQIYADNKDKYSKVHFYALADKDDEDKYWQFVRALYGKLLANGQDLLTFEMMDWETNKSVDITGQIQQMLLGPKEASRAA